MLRTLATLFALLAATASASASSSAWTKSEGGSIRIVTTGLSNEAGRLRGALEIRLEPGWKTYWRNPGDAGVPPQIELAPESDATGAKILFPSPERISDDYVTWAGYNTSVALPVVFTLPGPGMAGIIEGSAFLGICETICIPVEVPFSFDAGAHPDNAGDAFVVSEAFASLPGEARAGFRVRDIEREGKRLRFDVDLPEGSGEAALFVASQEDDVQIKLPELEKRDGATAIFSARIQSEAAPPGGAVTLHYTLVAGEEAVDGQIALP